MKPHVAEFGRVRRGFSGGTGVATSSTHAIAAPAGPVMPRLRWGDGARG
ncbi:hypothetical protein [Corynebacterium comes]|nr:hypothetical protein [Corynebacterium comes]